MGCEMTCKPSSFVSEKAKDLFLVLKEVDDVIIIEMEW